MSEKANFPADQTKVKQMLLGIAGMELREKKTRKPEKYAKLGLRAWQRADPSAVVTVLSDNGEVMADVILGNAKVAWRAKYGRNLCAHAGRKAVDGACEYSAHR